MAFTYSFIGNECRIDLFLPLGVAILVENP